MEDKLYNFIDNTLVNNISNPSSEKFYNLQYHLTPEEFYIYHFLAHAPDNFVPTVDWVAQTLGFKSKTTATKITNKLKDLGLLIIERVDNSFIWIVQDNLVSKTESKGLTEFKMGFETKMDEEELSIIESNIAQLEARYEASFGQEGVDDILDMILEERAKLRRLK